MYVNVLNYDVRAHGLIFYNGPTRATRDAGGGEWAGGGLADYIVLELHGGYPVLRVNHGSGEAKLEIDGRDAQRRRRLEPLNDGRGYRLTIQIIEFIEVNISRWLKQQAIFNIEWMVDR